MAIYQAAVGLLMALALTLVPLSAGAGPSPAAGDDAAGAEGAEGEEGEEGEEEGLDPIIDEDDEDELPGEEPSGLEELCRIDPDSCPQVDWDAEAAKALQVEMYAVQQIYALRARRFEINPYFGLTMNDQFVSHPSPGIAVNYYITNEIAAGINGNVYHGLNSESDFNFETSRAARIGMPITEYSWNVNANFTYVPAYGKFAGFDWFIFHYDVYLVAGVGAISTRPIAVVDPDNRTFEYEPTVTFGGGGGIRIFFNRYIAAMLEIRDYIFFDRLENPAIETGFDGSGRPNAQDPDTWEADDRSFTNNVQAQLGISVFLPFTWEYRLPK